MNSAAKETIVIVAAVFLILGFPPLGVWLLARWWRLWFGCLCLPLLILPGTFAINYYHVTYDNPREEVYSEAHRHPDDLLDYDPIAGNLAVLIVSWMPPTAAGLLAVLALKIVRRVRADPYVRVHDSSTLPA